MKGKILIALLALGASSVTLANGGMAPVAAEPNYFDGWFLGAGIGMQYQAGDISNDVNDSLSYTSTTTVSAPTPANQPTALIVAGSNASTGNQHLDADIGNNAFNGEIFAGYGQTFNTDYYAGIELYARFADANSDFHRNESRNASTNYKVTVQEEDRNQVTNTDLAAINSSSTASVSSSVSIDTDWSYGGDVKLGYLISPKTMFYILLGLEQTKFDVDVHHSSQFSDKGSINPLVSPRPGVTIPSIPFNVTSPAHCYNYGFDESKWAFVPGVGLETMLTDKLSLSAQYTYADYGSTSNHSERAAQLATPASSTTNITSGQNVIPVTTTYTAPNATSNSDTKVDLNRGLFTLRLTYRFNGI